MKFRNIADSLVSFPTPCLVCHQSCGSQRKTKERKISMKHLDQTLRDEAGEVGELEKRLLQEPVTKLVNYAKG